MDRYDGDVRHLADMPTYKSVERVLWIAAPIIVLFLLLNVPYMQAAQRAAEEDHSKTVAAENADYCHRWGMHDGSKAYDACIRDLVGIRARTEQHCLAQWSAGF